MTPNQSAAATGKSARPVPPPEGGTRRMDPASPHSGPVGARKPAGYGLPCAKCHLYYPGDLDMAAKQPPHSLYAAGWPAPSAPGTTHPDDAGALMAELRKRAGRAALLAVPQALAD